MNIDLEQNKHISTLDDFTVLIQWPIGNKMFRWLAISSSLPLVPIFGKVTSNDPVIRALLSDNSPALIPFGFSTGTGDPEAIALLNKPKAEGINVSFLDVDFTPGCYYLAAQKAAGKTTVAQAIVRESIEKGRTAGYYRWNEPVEPLVAIPNALPSPYGESIDMSLSWYLAQMFVGSPDIILIDSLRVLLTRDDLGGLAAGGLPRGIGEVLTDMDSWAKMMQKILFVTINPATLRAETIDEVVEMAGGATSGGIYLQSRGTASITLRGQQDRQDISRTFANPIDQFDMSDSVDLSIPQADFGAPVAKTQSISTDRVPLVP